MINMLTGTPCFDEDMKLIYQDTTYNIFIDDHCTRYEIYDNGNVVTGYIRLFMLNKVTNYIKIFNDIYIEVDRNDPDMYIDQDNIKNELYLIQLLKSEEVKKSIHNYINNMAGY